MTMLAADTRALVTGASSGIGRATALRFAAEGCAVALVGRDREALEATAEAVAEAGGTGRPVVADLATAEGCDTCVEDAVAALGGIDVLVNAAGIIDSGSVEETDRGSWSRMMRINLDAPFLLLKGALPYLRERPGSVVNVSSVAGPRAFPGLASYCVSKAGLDQLTRCAALDLADAGVRVNAVNPGVVVTELHRRSGMDEQAYAAFLEHSRDTHPLGRVGRPEEIAEAILFLASGDSGWITGVTLEIDGGRHLTCAR